MTAQAAQALSITPVVPVYNTAGASDTFPVMPSSKYLVHVKNANAGTVTVVINDPSSIAPAGNTAFDPDVTYTLATGTEKVIEVDTIRFRDSNGNVALTFSPNSSVTYAIYGPL